MYSGQGLGAGGRVEQETIVQQGIICPHPEGIFSTPGIKMDFEKKVWKRVNAKLVNGCICLLNEPQIVYPFQGVWGSSPRNFLASGVTNGAFQYHFGSLYSNTPTRSPSKGFSLQIYTDLTNGPGSWKKVWNQTQVWKFLSLYSDGIIRWKVCLQGSYTAQLV